MNIMLKIIPYQHTLGLHFLRRSQHRNRTEMYQIQEENYIERICLLAPTVLKTYIVLTLMH